MNKTIYRATIAITMISLGVTGLIAQQPNQVGELQELDIVIVVTAGRVRAEPGYAGDVIKESPMGTRFTAISEKDGWYEVRIEKASGEMPQKTAWISRSVTEPYDAGQPGIQFQRIANKYLSRREISFSTAKHVFEYLPIAADAAKTYEVGGDLRLKSLIALGHALKAIPAGKEDVSPYKEFLKRYASDIVYSEPSGEWYVKSELYWELHQRYRKHKIAETIAWQAAANPLPGECEGYIVCYLYLLRASQAEYLNFYPSGKYSDKAISNITDMLTPIASDVRTKHVYFTTSDISDRAEFNRMLSELRKIVSRTRLLEKQSVLIQIKQIAEGYR